MLLICLYPIQAQIVYRNPEEGYLKMTEYSAMGDYETAKVIAFQLLHEKPDYHDVTLHLARIYGWEHHFDTAYDLVDGVISQVPDLLEAQQTCVDLAYWDNSWDRLEECSVKALELGADSAAIAQKLLVASQIRDAEMENHEVYLYSSYDHFLEPYVRNWYMLTAGGLARLGPVSLNPYVNAGYLAGRTDQSTDFQLNLDAYITLGKKNYALAGYGYSPDRGFNYLPVHRAVAEFWQVLPAAFEISVGIRYFYWQEHFLFPTLSVEKYLGNYWFSFRNYLFFKEYGVSGSYYLSTRRYFATQSDYLTVTLGYGTAPDEPVIVISDLDRMNAISGRLDISKGLGKRVRLGMGVGYAYEEFQDSEFRHRISARLGCYIRLAR